MIDDDPERDPAASREARDAPSATEHRDVPVPVEDIWSGARDQVRSQVAGAFAATPQRCPSCGREEVTASRCCPHCGASYVFVRHRGLSRRARRLVAIAAAILIPAVVVVAVVLVAPSVRHAKRVYSVRAERESAALRARERRRLQRDQALHRGSARTLAPIPGAGAGARRQARLRLLRAVEASILADAQVRARARTLRGPVVSTSCEPYPPSVNSTAEEDELRRSVGRYQCLAATGSIAATEDTKAGSIGYPFWVRVDFGHFTYAWCKVNPLAGERGLQAEGVRVDLPRACNLDHQ